MGNCYGTVHIVMIHCFSTYETFKILIERFGSTTSIVMPVIDSKTEPSVCNSCMNQD